MWPYSCPIAARASAAGRGMQLNDEFLAPNGFWEIEGEPYTTAPGIEHFAGSGRASKAAAPTTGGASRCASAPADFRARSTDGMGDDWPITYEELAPYYDKVESYIGVFGSKENVPNAPDGVFLPPPKPRCTETIIKKACDQLNITCIPSRMAILTKPLNGRAACHYCAQCGRGCISASNFSSSQVMIPPAQATGRFTLIANAMAREIVVGKRREGRSRLLHRQGHAQRTARLCQGLCGGGQRLRIGAAAAQFALDAAFPTGWQIPPAWSGRYLTDSVGSEPGGIFSAARKDARAQSRRRGRHAHVHAVVEVRTEERFPARLPHRVRRRARHARRGRVSTACAQQHEGYGVALKQKCRSSYGTFIGFCGRGEMIPNEKSYCEIDPNVVDQWGIPVLRFHWEWGENEIKMAKDMQETFRAIVEAGGGTVLGSRIQRK